MLSYVNISVLLFNISLTNATLGALSAPVGQSAEVSIHDTTGPAAHLLSGAQHYHINFVNDLVIYTT